MPDKNNQSQKGVSLLITIMVLAIGLSIVLGLTAILIVQLRVVKSIGDSVVAIHAADTGVEIALKDIIAGNYGKYASTEEGTIGDASFKINIACCKVGTPNCEIGPLSEELTGCPIPLYPDDTCSAPGFCIKAIGDYKGTKRAIEVKVPAIRPKNCYKITGYLDGQILPSSDCDDSESDYWAGTFTYWLDDAWHPRGDWSIDGEKLSSETSLQKLSGQPWSLQVFCEKDGSPVEIWSGSQESESFNPVGVYYEEEGIGVNIESCQQ